MGVDLVRFAKGAMGKIVAMAGRTAGRVGKALPCTAILLLDVGLGWQMWPSLDRPVGILLSLFLPLVAFLMGAPPLLAAIVATLGVVRYMVFLLPLFKIIGNVGWTWPLLTWSCGVVWETLPILLPLWIAMHMLKRRAPAWAVLVVTAGLHSGLSVWIPRPYGLSLGATLVSECPDLVWALGCDLAGGLLLGLMVFSVAIAWYERSMRQTLGIGGLVLVFMGAAWGSHASWVADRYVKDDRFTHEVVLGQPNIRPFLGNFAMMSQYMIGPTVLIASLGPDLIVMPEGTIQSSSQFDPPDADGTDKRHCTAMATGVIAPQSQLVFGVRDFHTARAYFTDTLEGARITTWKDLERRAPVVDGMPGFLGRRIGWKMDLTIKAPERTPLMGLWALNDAGERVRMASAAVVLSGEIRDPRLMLEKVRRSPDVTVVVNPTISGWMGSNEAVGSSILARARALELGLVAYRSGQSEGTEVYFPWGRYAIKDATVRQLGGGSMNFTGYVPKIRPTTPYVAFGWILAFFVFPCAAGFTLLAWLIPPIRKSSLTVEREG